MSDKPPHVDDTPKCDSTDIPPRSVDAHDLFQGTREIWVHLDGVRYRLRITRRNKLILQK